MVGRFGGLALRARASRVRDEHSGLVMHVVGVRDGMLPESLQWWLDCITSKLKHQKEQYKL
jgi:hypothetical protein